MAELNFGLLNPPGSQSIGNAFVSGMDQAAVARAQENQNALSQYTLGKAKREDELTSQLLGDLRVATTPEEIYRAYQRVGKPDIALKMQTDALTQDELRGKIKLQPVALAAAKSKLVDDKLAQSRQYLDNINPDNPSAAQQYLAWHEANHNDLVLGPELAARGVTVEQSRARIDAALQQPGGLERLINESKVGVAKFAEMNKPSNVQRNTGNTVETLSIPGLGGAATVVPGSQATIQISPNTAATLKQAQDHYNGLSAYQKEQLRVQGIQFDPTRGVLVNIKTGTYSFVDPAGGAAPVGAPAVLGVAPAVSGGVTAAAPAPSGGVPGQRQAPAGQPAGRLGPTPEKPTWNSEAQGFIYPPSQDNPTGKFVAVQGMEGKPLNEVQAKSALFGSAMQQANTVITDLETKGTVKSAVVPGLITGIVKLAPLGVGDAAANAVESMFRADPTGLVGPDANQQRLAQAQLGFAIGYLRATSGAAFGAQEVANTIKEYFPLQGEGEKVIEQKAASRERAIQGMRLAAGKSGSDFINKYVPKVPDVWVRDNKGNLVKQPVKP